jgi:RHS repeat-associated protein
MGRIAQKVMPYLTEYYLTDALGSVRQVASGAGEVTLSKRYTPYGQMLDYEGSSNPSFGYAGKMQDSTGMVYLRARYYVPTDGRFVSRDTWEGDYNNPLTYNFWLYVYANPLRYTDPSGLDVGCNVDDPRDPRCHPIVTPPPANTPTPTSTPTPRNSESFQEQYDDLKSYFGSLPPNTSDPFIQVDLGTYYNVKQNTEIIQSKYGWVACGLVAAAAAMTTNDSEMLDLLNRIFEAAGTGYDLSTGMQPTPYADALSKVFGNGNVQAHNNWTLTEMYMELQNKKIVIIDATFKNGNDSRPMEATTEKGMPGVYSHFARVLGMGVNEKTIYIDNTMNGAKYLRLDLSVFFEIWKNPEDRAYKQPVGGVESNANRWAVVLNPDAGWR